MIRPSWLLLKLSLLFHLATEAEARASCFRFSHIDTLLGRQSDVEHARILTRLLELYPVFQMDQDKMIPMTPFGLYLKWSSH